MAKGKLIVFAGMNGAGKQVQMDLFVPWLKKIKKNNIVFWTLEPNELDDNGIKAREQLSKDRSPYENAKEALQYFCMNRKTHNNLFIPLLEKGVHVVSDRYYDSTFIYQHLQGISYDDIAFANREFLRPDLTFILQVPVEVAMERIAKDETRVEKKRKFEKDLEFAKKVAEEYNCLPVVLRRCMNDDSAVLVDGNREQGKVQEEIRERFNQRFH